MEKSSPLGQRLTVFLVLVVVIGGMWVVGLSGMSTGLTSGVLANKVLINTEVMSEKIDAIRFDGSEETHVLPVSTRGHDKGSDVVKLHVGGGGMLIGFTEEEFQKFSDKTGCCPLSGDIIGTLTETMTTEGLDFRFAVDNGGSGGIDTVYYLPANDGNIVLWSPGPLTVWGEHSWTETKLRIGREKDR